MYPDSYLQYVYRLKKDFKNCLSFLFCFLLLVTSCKNDHTTSASANARSDSNIQYAKNFTLEQFPSYTILKVKTPWNNSKAGLTYIVYDKGTTPPNRTDGIFIERPVRRIACTSTTHTAFLASLAQENKIVGISGTPYIYDKQIRTLIEQNKIEEIGFESDLNYEKLIELEPDIVFTYGISADNNIGKIKELGLTPVVIAEHLESTPLGRTEWLKFISIFTGDAALAKQQFKSISEDYNASRQFISEQKSQRPDVMVGISLSGTWFVPGGDSYLAQYIEDAGGNYLWKDQPGSASIQLDFETVFDQAYTADKWINIGVVKNTADIIASDSRYKDFKPLQENELYNFSRRISSGGGYDIYESGLVYPQIVLKDIAKAFHPELFPKHRWVYYEKLH